MGALVIPAWSALVSTAISLVIGILAAYALGRLHFPPGRIVLIAVLMISVFPQVVVLSGMFEVIGWLGLYNRPSALIVSYLILNFALYDWILTSFIPGPAERIGGGGAHRTAVRASHPHPCAAASDGGPAIASTVVCFRSSSHGTSFFSRSPSSWTDENRTVPVANRAF